MPTVPAYDLPTQELANVQLNTFQAPNAQVGNVNAANIQINDVAGKQAGDLAKATMSLGQQFQKIGDEIRDANVKVQDTATVSQMQDILYNKENGYLWTKGIDSKEKFTDAQERFTKVLSESRAQLKDPQEQVAYDRAVQRHMNTFNSAISRHAGEQIRVYSNGESEARQLKYQDMAIANFGTPQFNQYMNTALAEADARAELNGMGKDAREQLRLKSTNQIYGNVVTNLMINNKFTEARSVLEDASKKGLITEEAKLTLNRSLVAGYNRESGKNAGDNIFEKRGPAGSDANSVIQWVIGIEGGYVENDAGKGPTKFGINSAANPDIDVKNLTPEKATEIYKKRYWNEIGADKLPQDMRAIAFDAAVNQGVGTAKNMIAEAMKTDNPAQTLIDLRRAEYQKLVDKNPTKFAQYEKGWMNRLDQLEAGLGGESSLGGMLRQADTIADKEQREIARAQIKQRYSEDKAVKEADYKSKFDGAMDIAFKRDGGWADVPAPLWGQLKYEDQQKLINRPKVDNHDVVLDIMMNPDKAKKGIIEQYRPMLTESTYQRLFIAANGNNGEGKTIAASVESHQLENELRKAGLTDLLGTPKSDKDKQEKIQIFATIQNMIDAEQQARGGKTLSLDEKNQITRNALKPLTVKAVGWFNSDTTMQKRFYQVESPSNIQIPAAARNKILRDFEKARIEPTPRNILNAYLSMDENSVTQ